MRILLASDLHLSFYNKFEKEIIFKKLSEQSKDVDLLVLAGDNYQYRNNSKFIKNVNTLRDYIKVPVLEVFGNHEFYNNCPANVLDNIRSIQPTLRDLNYHVIENDVFEFMGKRFLCGTMWVPYDPLNQLYEKYMNDFSCIENCSSWIYDQHLKWAHFFDNNCKQGDIIVTHHSPHICSSKDCYFYSNLNRFFIANQYERIVGYKPSHWLHGHVHNVALNKIEGCTIACCTLGYNGEIYEDLNDFGGMILDI